MPNLSSKRPRDTNKLAKLLTDLAYGKAELPKTDDGKAPASVALGRKGGLNGRRKARAAKMTVQERSAVARDAAKERWKSD